MPGKSIVRTRANSGFASLGPKSEIWLREVGIGSTRELRDVGIAEAFRRMVIRDFPVNASMLYGLEAELTGTLWKAIPNERKRELRQLAEGIKLSLQPHRHRKK